MRRRRRDQKAIPREEFQSPQPVALMLTVAGLEEAQMELFVRFCVLPSLKVPMAVN